MGGIVPCSTGANPPTRVYVEQHAKDPKSIAECYGLLPQDVRYKIYTNSIVIDFEHFVSLTLKTYWDYIVNSLFLNIFFRNLINAIFFFLLV